ncbi:hypothetical protein Sango_0242000 [Sesamum angolense]|uniref:Uncharacterized protein n=1 Tax=Sesamum angolense TaxID=2727404 RepID=A0AAE1XGT9_9LAMI|nr:hypothetical protein Sango_0242000 [Sesamum angolense]
MSLALQAIFTNKNPTFLCSLFPTRLLKSVNLSFSATESRTHFPNHRFLTSQCHVFSITKIKASLNEPYGTSLSQANGGGSTLNHFSFDAFLSTIEFFSLASSAAISVYVALRSGVQQGGVLGRVGSNILVWQCVVLVSSVVVGAVIRRRQWRRIFGAGFSSGSVSYGVNLLGRVEKLEEDLRSSATIIRVLSRQLEKLGIRVRVTRKALREPISETAALAQKNSEATRALAVQEDILEKELGEIQKVLLAMQNLLLLEADFENWCTVKEIDYLVYLRSNSKNSLSSFLQLGKLGSCGKRNGYKPKIRMYPRRLKPAVNVLPHLETNQVEVPALQRQANNKTS